MRLLLTLLADLYSGPTHVRNEGLQTDDDTVWAYPAHHGFAIVPKDADLHQRSSLLDTLRRKQAKVDALGSQAPERAFRHLLDVRRPAVTSPVPAVLGVAVPEPVAMTT